jgi:hypothetical protein
MSQSRLPSANHGGMAVPLLTCSIIWGSILGFLTCGSSQPTEDDQAEHLQANEAP